jgi:hypothetical protein
MSKPLLGLPPSDLNSKCHSHSANPLVGCVILSRRGGHSTKCKGTSPVRPLSLPPVLLTATPTALLTLSPSEELAETPT